MVVARPFNLLGAGMPGHLVAASFARQIADVVRLALLQLSPTGVDVEVRTSSVLVKQVDIPQHYGSTARLLQLVGPGSPRGLETMLRDVLAGALEGP